MRGRKDGTEDVDEHGRRLSLFTKDLNKLALDPSHGGAMTVKEYWLTGMPGYMSIAYKDAAPVAEAYDTAIEISTTFGRFSNDNLLSFRYNKYEGNIVTYSDKLQIYEQLKQTMNVVWSDKLDRQGIANRSPLCSSVWCILSTYRIRKDDGGFFAMSVTWFVLLLFSHACIDIHGFEYVKRFSESTLAVQVCTKVPCGTDV
eukprot:GHVQ01010369.1.p1 GENE.GHVQ01010369.1~~GHVQ01010369.1.p1  ORF type:complete len:201 (-),score=18.47 GHVQ01010369.1:99-701(-)